MSGLSDVRVLGVVASSSEQSRTRVLVQHILDAIQRIGVYTDGMTRDGFLGSSVTQDAVIRNIEVVGEACRNIMRHHPDFAGEHASVPWRSSYEMRNALSHGYFDIDLYTVWETLRVDLPAFGVQIAALPVPSGSGVGQEETTSRNCELGENP